MKRPHLLSLAGFLLPVLLFPSDTCRITYIANEGFLIELADKRILCDALFDEIDGDWCDSPSAETVQLMESAAPPFNNIDLITISHNHVDHFNADIVIKHLLHNPNGLVVCPEQVKALLAEHPSFSQLQTRIYSVTPDLYQDSTLTVSGLDLRVLRLEHSHYEITDPVTGEVKNKHASIENLGFVIRYAGQALFHCGDTNPLNKREYEGFDLISENLDVSLLERQFIAAGAIGLEIINNYIGSNEVILMHMNPNNKKAFMDYAKQVPHLTVFEQMLESRNFPKRTTR